MDLLEARVCQECETSFQPGRRNEIRCKDCRELKSTYDRFLYHYRVPATDVQLFMSQVAKAVRRKSKADARQVHSVRSSDAAH